jgi:hypothetical protein
MATWTPHWGFSVQAESSVRHETWKGLSAGEERRTVAEYFDALAWDTPEPDES